MIGNTLPPRRRIMPIERFAGVAQQFERTDGGYLFRRHGVGPAIRVSPSERDAFARAALWSAIIHAVVFVVCAVAGWAIVDRMLASRGETAVAIGFGIVLSLIAMGLYGSLRWTADAPGRALAGRPVERPAREAVSSDRQSYGTIVGITLFLLFMAAIGTEQPPGFYIVFATVAVMAGLFLAVRRWWTDRGMTREQHLRLETLERRDAEHAAARTATLARRDRRSGWTILLLLFLAVFQMVALFGGFYITATIVLALADTAIEDASGATLAIAIIGGLIVAGLSAWIVERVCRWLTGESAIDSFNVYPFGW